MYKWKCLKKVWYRQIDSSPSIITIQPINQDMLEICFPPNYSLPYKVIYPTSNIVNGIIKCNCSLSEAKDLVDTFLLKLKKLKVFL